MTHPPVAKRPARWPLISLCLWLVLVAGMFAVLWTFESTAGPQGDPEARWPKDASLKLTEEGRTLLMFAHPRCPCTRASMKELEQVLAKRPGLESARIIFFRPPGAGDDWTDSSLVRTARSMTGVDVSFDEGGLLAQKFGVETSGHVLLYDADETLLFSGGITALRNHEGANAGREAVSALSQGQPSALKETPIYGCPLHNRASCCPEKTCEVQP
jgi:hypothetical protein